MPTATRHEFLDMRVTDVRRVRESARDHIVVLAEPGGAHRLPIWIGRDEARPIALRLLGVQLQRPLTHDLAVHLVEAQGGSVREVRIDRLADQTFYAAVVLDGAPANTSMRPDTSRLCTSGKATMIVCLAAMAPKHAGRRARQQ